ncbi:hypothetical protein [Silvibacterium sp.]|uniref:hypothetical protein n=1 Tax=Silvibacterium sp. TaxID=1964179 RepID=UPI0039E2A249
MLDVPFHKLDLIRRSLSLQEPAVCQAFLDIEDEFFAMQRRLLKLQEELLHMRGVSSGNHPPAAKSDSIPHP